MNKKKTTGKKEKKMKRSKRKAVIDLSDEEKSEEEMSLDQTDNGVVTVCPVADCDREQISARDVESAVQKDCVANETNNTMSDQDDLDVEQFGPQVSGVKPDGKGFRLSGTKFLLTFPKQSTSQVQELDLSLQMQMESRVAICGEKIP